MKRLAIVTTFDKNVEVTTNFGIRDAMHCLFDIYDFEQIKRFVIRKEREQNESLASGFTEKMSVEELETFVRDLNNVMSNPKFTKRMKDYFVKECEEANKDD